ncbi:MAG: hypothetical protein PUD41_10620, partial [bacterium]|nr:hypothetical protein [bacterium]
PRLRALGLSPSAFNLSGWILLHTNNHFAIKTLPLKRGETAKINRRATREGDALANILLGWWEYYVVNNAIYQAFFIIL